MRDYSKPPIYFNCRTEAVRYVLRRIYDVLPPEESRMCYAGDYIIIYGFVDQFTHNRNRVFLFNLKSTMLKYIGKDLNKIKPYLLRRFKKHSKRINYIFASKQ